MVGKATSNMLEIWVEISRKDLLKIIQGSFQVNLEYTERGQNKRIIPMSIKYSINQNEPILFSGEPEETYFGDCNKLNFTISQDYLNSLIHYNQCDERFMNSGRLKVKIK